MSIKVDSFRKVPVRQKAISMLFKRGNYSKKILNYDANNVVRDVNISPWNSFIFKVLDMMSPFINRHPKFGAGVVKLSEKLIKNSADL